MQGEKISAGSSETHLTWIHSSAIHLIAVNVITALMKPALAQRIVAITHDEFQYLLLLAYMLAEEIIILCTWFFSGNFSQINARAKCGYSNDQIRIKVAAYLSPFTIIGISTENLMFWRLFWLYAIFLFLLLNLFRWNGQIKSNWLFVLLSLSCYRPVYAADVR